MDKYINDFPFVKAGSVVYCDNAATTHKPQIVIDAISNFYARENAPVHRGIYALAENATKRFEGVREQVCRFIGAAEPAEIVFTRGTTEGLNMIVQAWGEKNLKAGDEIVISEIEHHAMLVPWQQFAKKTGTILKYIPMLSDGRLDYEKVPAIISKKTKIVGITGGSNVIGISTNLDPIIKCAHEVGAIVVVDAAQMAPHERINVQALGCEVLVFSGHKLCGPTGIGVVYLKKTLHESLQPYMVGGSMVFSVDWQESRWREMPQMLEAGTPPIVEVIGLGAAIDYLEKIDFKELAIHEASLCKRFIEGIEKIPGIRILGPADLLKKAGHLVSFVVEGVHPYDVASYLDRFKIAVRAGHHCAQPLHTKLGVAGSVRASFYLYNTAKDVDAIVTALQSMQKK